MFGRQSGDNIIVTWEIFYSMRSKKERKGWMTIKIDFEKAYEDLVRDTLHDVGIPENIWVHESFMECQGFGRFYSL